MANDFNDSGALTPTIIGEWSLQYLRTRSAMLGRTATQTFFEGTDVQAGGDHIVIPKPTATAKAPVVVTPGNSSAFASVTDLTTDSVTINFNNHYGHKVSANQLESRIAKGNFEMVMQMNWGSLLDGIAIKIDKTITGLYSGLSRSVGTGGTALTDANIRLALQKLTDTNVLINPSSTTFVGSTATYWNDLLGNSLYTKYLERGDQDALIQGKLRNMYGCAFDYSPNIIKTTVTGPPAVTTTHNFIFDKLAFIVGYFRFEPIEKYAPAGIAGVMEEYVNDSESGLTLRVLKYFDTNSLTWFWSIDVKWGVAVYDDNRAVEVLS